MNKKEIQKLKNEGRHTHSHTHTHTPIHTHTHIHTHPYTHTRTHTHTNTHTHTHTYGIHHRTLHQYSLTHIPLLIPYMTMRGDITYQVPKNNNKSKKLFR